MAIRSDTAVSRCYQVAIGSPQQLPADSYGRAIRDSPVIAEQLLPGSYALVAISRIAELSVKIALR